MRVRENAAEQLEERQGDWAYSKPVVLMDVLWNASIVGIGVVVLWLSVAERPSVPLRGWIVGYILQCVFHMVCVAAEYRRRQREPRVGESEASSGVETGGDSNSWSGSEAEEYTVEQERDDYRPRYFTF